MPKNIKEAIAEAQEYNAMDLEHLESNHASYEYHGYSSYVEVCHLYVWNDMVGATTSMDNGCMCYSY